MDSEYITGTVIVVGGCGFLGHHIVNEVFKSVAGSPHVVVIDMNTNRNRHPSARYYTADISRRDEVTKIFEEIRPQVVFHTASPNPFIVDRSVLEKVNVVGTQNLIECAKAVGTVRAFVYTSSSSVVHDQRQPMIEATEDLPLLFYPDQPELYSHTKALGDKIVLSANRENGMLTASIRPAAMYGAGCGIMTTNLTKLALDGRAKYRFGTGPYLFDITYVENCTRAQILVAQALVKAAALAPLSSDTKVEGEAFFVTNDEHIPFWSVQRLVAEVAGLPVKDEEVRCIPIWLVMIIVTLTEWVYWVFSLGRKAPMLRRWGVRIMTMERTLCIDKAKKRLGYKPKFTNREGWVKTLEWSVPSVKAAKKEKDV